MRIDNLRRRVWGRVLAAVLVALPVGLMAQTEGPLTIKIPPRRPRAERPAERDEPSRSSERPVLRRAPDAEGEAADNPCPAGYIPVPTADADERPRLTRNPSSEPAETESEPAAVECMYVGTADGRDRGGGRCESEGPEAAFLDRVRRNVRDLSIELPDFTCTQLTRRLENLPNGRGWRLIDRIQADVLFVDNKEEYRNIRRNGEAIESPEDTGAWTSGEFGVWLQDLFLWQVDAGFTPAGTKELDGVEARLFDFSVKQEDSRWLVKLEDQSSELAYKGTVWIDPANHRVLRLEVQATDLPAEYPLGVLEASVDYGPVRIGDVEYVLPVESESLSCARETDACVRNEIEFLDYGKFTVESSVSAADAQEPE